MHISITAGLNFGDEGKGSVVNHLCKDPKTTLVIRHNSGHQAGHTVVHNKIRHSFSNFGSGTLKGIPTYWSEYCTIDPRGVLKEGNVLREQGINPVIYFDGDAIVTTPYDIYYNINDRENKSHGTVGVGFGTTIQRNEDHYHLYVRDLMFPTIRDFKLELIQYYYYNKTKNLKFFDLDIVEFKNACNDLVNRFEIVNNNDYDKMILSKSFLIFEGSQGIMLDSNYGFFPYVTRSNTTSKNAMELIKKWGIQNKIRHIFSNFEKIDIYYITRAYQTRHGRGFMSNENLNNSCIKTNPLETNLDTGMQGVFRRTILDLDQLKYALLCDKTNHTGFPYLDYKLVITCCDHVDKKIPVTINTILSFLTAKEIADQLNIFCVYTSNSDKGNIKIL